MTHEEKTSLTDAEQAEARKNAEAIKDTDATRHDARGNVHSESEEAVGEPDAPPPPLPN